MRHEKKQENVANKQDKKQAMDTAFEEAQLQDISEKDFKPAEFINMFKGLKETILKEIKGSYDDNVSANKNINKEIKIAGKNSRVENYDN